MRKLALGLLLGALVLAGCGSNSGNSGGGGGGSTGKTNTSGGGY
jgi:ABC-type glycerol-3-phosphate transport system substrate-binding protein